MMVEIVIFPCMTAPVCRESSDILLGDLLRLMLI
jgi:hypothetical protein